MASYEQMDQVDTDQSRKGIHGKRDTRIERGLPENYNYRDTGCELAPSCLECPLATCKYDDPAYGRSGRTMFRDREIVRLRMQGSRVSEIAKSVCTSERTVYRVIQRDRDKIVGVVQPAASDSRVLEVANAF